jgi:hypothetical protein
MSYNSRVAHPSTKKAPTKLKDTVVLRSGDGGFATPVDLAGVLGPGALSPVAEATGFQQQQVEQGLLIGRGWVTPGSWATRGSNTW